VKIFVTSLDDCLEDERKYVDNSSSLSSFRMEYALLGAGPLHELLLLRLRVLLLVEGPPLAAPMLVVGWEESVLKK
jgi:hypothetical protein